MIKRKEIVDVLINVLQEIQQTIVDEPEDIGEATVPIRDLLEFDSLASVEATVNAFAALKLEPSLSCPSIFISKDSKALTLGQVADRILELNENAK